MCCKSKSAKNKYKHMYFANYGSFIRHKEVNDAESALLVMRRGCSAYSKLYCCSEFRWVCLLAGGGECGLLSSQLVGVRAAAASLRFRAGQVCCGHSVASLLVFCVGCYNFRLNCCFFSNFLFFFVEIFGCLTRSCCFFSLFAVASLL